MQKESVNKTTNNIDMRISLFDWMSKIETIAASSESAVETTIEAKVSPITRFFKVISFHFRMPHFHWKNFPDNPFGSIQTGSYDSK